MTVDRPPPPTRPALVIAHPGHELRVHGWLERARPRTFVLTDGSGRSGRSRLSSTSTVLDAAGAEPGPIYGRLSDRTMYAAILDGDVALFLALAEELAAAFARDGVDAVAGDAVEGYNPAHDVCRLLIEAAIDIARTATGREIASFDFALAGAPDACADELRSRALRLDLDADAFARKHAAARRYAELADEVDVALDTNGAAAFRVELLRPVDRHAARHALAGASPAYERHGERRVAAGHYRRVLRYRDHVAPLAAALREHAAR
ncbi:MAG TPA: hypothetical protein VKA21_12560 [Candidatus Binatia bacterium]|nr:hypothetical protein [Candidatus Binatia bacterium]